MSSHMVHGVHRVQVHFIWINLETVKTSDTQSLFCNKLYIYKLKLSRIWICILYFKLSAFIIISYKKFWIELLHYSYSSVNKTPKWRWVSERLLECETYNNIIHWIRSYTAHWFTGIGFICDSWCKRNTKAKYVSHQLFWLLPRSSECIFYL